MRIRTIAIIDFWTCRRSPLRSRRTSSRWRYSMLGEKPTKFARHGTYRSYPYGELGRRGSSALLSFNFLRQSLKKIPQGPFAGEPSSLFCSKGTPNYLHAEWSTLSVNLPCPRGVAALHGDEIVGRQIGINAAHNLNMRGSELPRSLNARQSRRDCA